MYSDAAYAETLPGREALYRFLSRVYRLEIDEALLGGMRKMSFPTGCADDELENGYRMLEEFLKNCGDDALTELAVDYARVFLGAGLALPNAAYPFESVYTSQNKLFMQEARDEVAALYREKGLRAAEMAEVPEDHIAFELEYMACLCGESQKAIAADGACMPDSHAAGQKEFLKEHLLRWTAKFCADVVKYAETDFYKAVAGITNGWLRMDSRFLASL